MPRIAYQGGLRLPDNQLPSMILRWVEPKSSQFPTINFNYLLGANGESMGFGDRSTNAPSPESVQTYAALGTSGPDGETWPIEIEVGDTSVPLRHPGTATLREFNDIGWTGYAASDVDRCTVTMRQSLLDIGHEEERMLWVGWSEYWTRLDLDRTTTLLQFRNQPYADADFIRQGIDPSLLSAQQILNLGGTGPCVGWSFQVEDELRWVVEVRDGTISLDSAIDWSIPAGQRYVVPLEVETDCWFDFVIAHKPSQGSTGRVALWHSKVVDGFQTNPMQLGSPDWNFTGRTEYVFPVVQGVQMRCVPECRWDIYRHESRTGEITEANRYMQKHTGPIRYSIGDNRLAAVNPQSVP